MLVLGVFLLISAIASRRLRPLAAMGSMTLTLYSLHRLALAPEVHYDLPALWFTLHLAAAVAFAWSWHRSIGKGPLEAVVGQAVNGVREAVAESSASVTVGGGPCHSQPGRGIERGQEPPGTLPTLSAHGAMHEGKSRNSGVSTWVHACAELA